MRKLIAFTLAIVMLFTALPAAFAAGETVAISQTAHRYYITTDNKTQEIKGSSVGGISYVQAKHSSLVNWQIPGNTLTGNPTSWGKWLEITATVTVSGLASGTTVYIDGAAYKIDSNGAFTMTVYCLMQEGGNTATRALNVYDSAGKLLGRTNLTMVYEDLYTPNTSVSTGGINKDNTYAYLDGDTIIVEVVYSKMKAVVLSSNASNANYNVPDYYPVQLQLLLLDKDNNKFPAFTRVDVTKMTSSDLTFTADTVPNYVNYLYLNADSTLVVEKRFQPAGTLKATLEVYKKAAILYGGYTADGQKLIGGKAPYNGIQNLYVSGQAFDATRFGSWTESDLSVAGNGVNEGAIRNVIDGAIEAYYKDPANPTLYGAYASADATALYAALEALAKKIGQTLPAVTQATTMEEIRLILGLIDADAAIQSDIKALGSDYALEKLLTVYDLLLNPQVTTRVNTAIIDAKNAYRADIATSLTNILQYNANLNFNKIDTINLRLTEPSGKTSAQTLNIEYRSVASIAPKANLTMEGGNVTVKAGESVTASAKVYKDGAQTTSVAVKYQSVDPGVATATSTSGSVSGIITGVKEGQTLVRAYIETTSGGKTVVEAEAYLIVTVTAATVAPTPTPAPATTDYVCKVRKLNVRAGASTKHAKVGFVSRNDLVKVYEVVNGWAKIEWNNGTAYASIGGGKYLQPR